MPKACGEAVEHGVERRRQPSELVVRITRSEAMVEVVLGPVGGLSCHPGDWAKRAAYDEPGGDEDQDEEGERETQRGGERPCGAPLVRLERDTHDDGPHTNPAVHDRRR